MRGESPSPGADAPTSPRERGEVQVSSEGSALKLIHTCSPALHWLCLLLLSNYGFSLLQV